MKQGLRAFCLGFFPTLCFWGLLAGLGTVWVNTQSVLTPAEQPLVLRSEAPGRYVLEVFSERYEFALPVLPDKPEIFSRYPVLAPRSLRLLAWGWEELSRRMSMSKITEKSWPGWRSHWSGSALWRGSTPYTPNCATIPSCGPSVRSWPPGTAATIRGCWSCWNRR